MFGKKLAEMAREIGKRKEREGLGIDDLWLLSSCQLSKHLPDNAFARNPKTCYIATYSRLYNL